MSRALSGSPCRKDVTRPTGRGDEKGQLPYQHKRDTFFLNRGTRKTLCVHKIFSHLPLSFRTNTSVT